MFNAHHKNYSTCEGSTSICPTLQRKTLRHKEDGRFAQGHRVAATYN